MSMLQVVFDCHSCKILMRRELQTLAVSELYNGTRAFVEEIIGGANEHLFPLVDHDSVI